MRFALDTPAGRDLDGVTRFSGWCLTDDGMPVDGLFLRVNGADAVQLERLPRLDLVGAFPQYPEAAQGGFAGDLALPGWAAAGARFDVEVIARHQQAEQVMARRTFRLDPKVPARTPRARSYQLTDILERAPVADIWGSAASARARAPVSWPAFVLGAAHFHDAGGLPTLRLLEHGATNAYSSGALDVINATRAPALFLDLGCGIRREQDMRPNGVYLDAVHFRDVDIVSTQARLPLRDNSVDAVVSLSVFEHLPDPFAMAAEIRRVLKPGGTAWIETAFMQPLHADPGHYFNMTLQGLLRTFSGFEIDESGVLSHHVPSQSLRMQLDHVLPYMQDGEWKRTLSALLGRLVSDGAALDDAMGPIGRRILAAGVYFRGRNTGKS